MTDILLALNGIGIYMLVWKTYSTQLFRQWYAAKEAKRIAAARSNQPTNLPVRPFLTCVLEDGTQFDVRSRIDGSIPAIARPPGGKGSFYYHGECDAIGRPIFSKTRPR